VADVSLILDREIRRGEILFEGAQDAISISITNVSLCKSSNTVSPMFMWTNRSNAINKVVGICKAYTTVSGRPFSTELNDQVGEHLQQSDRIRRHHGENAVAAG
jgi:adenylosuccinate synthase